mmetsp:Transcript_33637/g.84448  ORF Transcript_33637/g.84448 Transcript_33637/m.84448 type:complete len:300 (-) Transcript_33637:24-923(-)
MHTSQHFNPIQQGIMSDSIFRLSESRTVKVHPVVLLSVLDHFTRRKENQRRVIGALLGVVTDDVVEIRNSFPVPHTEDKEVAVDMQNLFELHKKVNPNEVYVGWYSTGLTINQQSVMIHNYFDRQMDSSPIHLCVDTDLSDGNMDIRAFESSPLGAVDGSSMERSIGFHFKPLPVAVSTFQSGALGLAELSRSKSDDSALRKLNGETSGTKFAIQELQKRLAVAQQYVDDVLAGKVVPDKKTGRMLMDVVSSIPPMSTVEGGKRFNNTLQDILMIGYLSNLTRAQLALSERLQFGVLPQ